MTLDPIAQQVGVGGGVFLGALGLLLKYRPWESHQVQSNGSSGSRSVDYWKTEIHEGMNEAIKQILLPLMASQTDILRELKVIQSDSQKALTKIVTLVEIIEKRGPGG